MRRRLRHEKKLPPLCVPSIDAQIEFQHYVKRLLQKPMEIVS